MPKIIKRGNYYRLKCPRCGIIFWCSGHCQSFALKNINKKAIDIGYFGNNGECKCENCDNSQKYWKAKCDFKYNLTEPFVFR